MPHSVTDSGWTRALRPRASGGVHGLGTTGRCAEERSRGELYGVLDGCSHVKVAPFAGEVQDDTIEGRLHGSCFDLTAGRPSTRRIPSASAATPTSAGPAGSVRS